MLLFSGLVGLASAQPGAARSPHVLASVEVGATPPRLGDPARGELGVALAWLASPWFAVELGGSFYPDLGRGEMDERLQRLQERLYPASITKVQFSAQALTVFSPIHGRFHSKLGSTFSVDLGLGFGLVLHDSCGGRGAQGRGGVKRRSTAAGRPGSRGMGARGSVH